MNPRIYESKAAKQAEYRQAKALGMTCKQYRAGLADGTITPPTPTHENKGWFGRGENAADPDLSKAWHSTVTPPVQRAPKPERTRNTHLASTDPKSDRMTLCGRFQEDTTIATDFCFTTCSKCRTVQLARQQKAKVTAPAPTKPKSATAIKRAVRFYTGMMEELFSVREDHWTKEDPYTRLLTLHGGEGRYPWVTPTKGYTLPPTEEEFQAQYDAAMKDFDALIAEGKDAPKITQPTVSRTKTHLPVPNESGLDVKAGQPMCGSNLLTAVIATDGVATCKRCLSFKPKYLQAQSSHGDNFPPDGDKSRETNSTVTPLDAVKAMAASIYPSVEEK